MRKNKIAILQANLRTMMNRIFHVKIMTGTYVWLALLSLVMGGAFWFLHPLTGLAAAMLLVVTIESIIHSTYTLTAEGQLVVYRGRFLRSRTIDLSTITDVELRHSHGMGGWLASDYVLVHVREARACSLVPLKPEEFIRALVRRLEQRTD